MSILPSMAEDRATPNGDAETPETLRAEGDELAALTGARVEQTSIGDTNGEAASGWPYAAIIMLALAANYAIFRFILDTNYIHWYVANGTKLTLALTIFSLAIKLDDEPGLISAHPTQYTGAWLAFFGQGVMWLARIVKPGASEPGSVPFWDGLVTGLFAIAWTATALTWMVVVVPALYCVSLVCGAPIRMTLNTPSDTLVTQIPSNKTRSRKTWIPTRAKTINVGLNVKEKPVTATAAISAAALFALSFTF